MARPRQLRHKLRLGLLFVVASVGLLLGGTLFGISSYTSTVRTTERKLEELSYLTVVIDTLKRVDEADDADKPKLKSELTLATEKVQDTAAYLPKFRDMVAETAAAGLDPGGGEAERALVAKLEAALRTLDAAFRAAANSQMTQTESKPLRADEKVRVAFDEARRVAENLRYALIDDIRISGERSGKAIRQSLWIVGVAVAAAVLLVLTLLYYFRVWVFAPVRAIQAGVRRVHAGDFDHPIGLPPGNELGDLAAEFNAMTARVSETQRDLARQVNERSRQLVRSERMVSVGFLAAGVAHEINNPLASIAFCGEALERRLHDVLAAAMGRAGPVDPADADVLTRYLGMIQQEAFRCKEITTKLLDFSRTGERHREPTDLAGLVRGVLEIARHLPNSRSKTVRFDPDSYIVAPVNAQDLKSVILNLVVNALDSTDDGGSLTIKLAAKDGQAELSFTDTGCGMPPEVLENIFEPFFTKSRTGKGTGLGLFISHQIVDQHGGTIQATSPGPGRGSTFTVRVPLEQGQGEPEMAEAVQDLGPSVIAFPGGSRAVAAA